jgi:hypothetical protein
MDGHIRGRSKQFMKHPGYARGKIEDNDGWLDQG